MNTKKLTELYNAYNKNKTGYKKLQNELHKYIYLYPKYHYTHKINKDLCGDFWSSQESKVHKYITNFANKGVPFGNYIHYLLRFQFVTFLDNYFSKTRKLKLYEEKDMAISLNHNLVQENSIEEYVQSPKKNSKLVQIVEHLSHKSKSNADKQRLWWFLLCNSPILPKTSVYDIALELGINKSKLNSVLYNLQNDITIQQNRKRRLEEKCNFYFIKRCIHEQNLEQTVLLTHERDYNIKMREIYKHRFNKTLQKIHSMNFTISHSKISQILQIPKGTIDSGIALLRKKLYQIKLRNIDAELSMAD